MLIYQMYNIYKNYLGIAREDVTSAALSCAFTSSAGFSAPAVPSTSARIGRFGVRVMSLLNYGQDKKYEFNSILLATGCRYEYRVHF
ncbi:MAG TPA: hypothetical protein VEM15_13600 [Thermodesulfobacteriota bacterium]|nr:hypothetical protein [Thermodesulfobacteriota bacterium]